MAICVFDRTNSKTAEGCDGKREYGQNGISRKLYCLLSTMNISKQENTILRYRQIKLTLYISSLAKHQNTISRSYI